MRPAAQLPIPIHHSDSVQDDLINLRAIEFTLEGGARSRVRAAPGGMA